jgi:NADP-dependent 3-hydroxy acid dehydrogenase YdfG
MKEGLAQWKGIVALVTGASSGIGRQLAIKLAHCGMRVAITGRRLAALELVKRELGPRRRQLLLLPGDQTHPEVNHRIFRQIRSKWGGVDLLINNAGTSGGQMLDADLTAADAAIDLNIRATLRCLKEAVIDMRGNRRRGTIIVISSLIGHRLVPDASSTVYAATKQALRVMTEGLRNELASVGSPIKVATISPGVVDTPWYKVHGEKRAAMVGGFTPLHADDVVETALFILTRPPHVQVCDILIRAIGQRF